MTLFFLGVFRVFVFYGVCVWDVLSLCYICYFFIILHSIALYCIVLYCFILFYIVLYCFILFLLYSIQFYSIIS